MAWILRGRRRMESSAECWDGIQGQMEIGFTLFTWAKWNNGYRGSHFLLWPKLDLLQHRLHWIMHNSASLCHRTRCYTTMPGSAAARDVTRLCLALQLHCVLHNPTRPSTHAHTCWLCSLIIDSYFWQQAGGCSKCRYCGAARESCANE